MSTKKKPNPHSRFYGLISQMNGVDKEELIWEYSHKLTTSLSEFYDKLPADYKRMITNMQRIVDQTAYEQRCVQLY